MVSSSSDDDWYDNGYSSDDDCESWTESDIHRWHQAVNSVHRKSGPHLTRAQNVYDRRAPARQLTPEAQGRLEGFIKDAHRWNGYSSEDVVKR